MEAKVTFLGHSVHQMRIVFPLGLLGGSVCFDVVFLISDVPTMATVAYWLQAGGLLGAVLAVPSGLRTTQRYWRIRGPSASS